MLQQSMALLQGSFRALLQGTFRADFNYHNQAALNLCFDSGLCIL